MAGFCNHISITDDDVECDGSGCTHGDACNNGICIPGDTDCTDQLGAGRTGTCEPAPWGGEYCSEEYLPQGAACMTEANLNGSCSEWGECIVECTAHLDCDDGQPCTLDFCDVFTGTCVHQNDYSAWDCVPCYDEFDCVKASVCMGGTQHWRLNATGLCIDGACELDPTPQACPNCDSFGWGEGGVAEVGLCEEQLLCPGGGPCEVDPGNPPETDCATCSDDIAQTFSVCLMGGECFNYESEYCSFSGNTWSEEQGCFQCYEDTDCEDGNPCSSEGTCNTGGYCSYEWPWPNQACDVLPSCGEVSDPPCEWGNCVDDKCIVPKTCTTDFQCPGHDRPFCYKGSCQPCLPALDDHEDDAQHIGCWSVQPICEGLAQADPVTGDSKTLYSCVED